MSVATKPKPITKTFEDATTQVKENYEGIVKAGQEQAAKTLEQTASVAKEQAGKISAQLLKSYADIQTLAKGNVEALIESSTIATQGTEDLSREVVAYTQSTFDKTITTTKAVITAKSLKEVVDLQSEFAKTSFDSFVSEASRITELTNRVTNDAFAPLTARFNAALALVTKPLTA